MTPAQLLAAFLGGVSADRVALHKSLDDSFESAVTLADPEAWRSVQSKIAQHFADVGEVADAIAAEAKGRGLGILASIMVRANANEAELVHLTSELLAARQRLAGAYEDAELKQAAEALKGKVSALVGSVVETLAELRCEGEDME
mmetsp:Transcript_982/g.2522  ORF Transcript_982/g.2522 Transcript_982/m.2522 type:complete len:145 (+) Transcript_982:236-670(+)